MMNLKPGAYAGILAASGPPRAVTERRILFFVAFMAGNVAIARIVVNDNMLYLFSIAS
jgi:hypothetical protein